MKKDKPAKIAKPPKVKKPKHFYEESKIIDKVLADQEKEPVKAPHVYPAKYLCVQAHQNEDGTGIIELHASRYDKTEGKQVVDITSEGTLDIKAVNVKAIRGLVKGKEYYINIVEA